MGDNPARDIRGAKKVGMKTALAVYGWVLNKDSRIKADHNLQRPSDLLKIL